MEQLIAYLHVKEYKTVNITNLVNLSNYNKHFDILHRDNHKQYSI